MRRIRHDIGVLLRLARDAWRQYFGTDSGGAGAKQTTD